MPAVRSEACRYFERDRAAVSIASAMGIAFKFACDAMDGKKWLPRAGALVDRVMR